MSLKDKIATICREMYGAVGVEYSELAEQRLAVRGLQLILCCSLLVDQYHFLPNAVLFCMWYRIRNTLPLDTATCPSAWPRHSTPWALTPPPRAYLLASPSSSEMFVPPLVPVISILSVETSWPFLDYQPALDSTMLTWTWRLVAWLVFSKHSFLTLSHYNEIARPLRHWSLDDYSLDIHTVLVISNESLNVSDAYRLLLFYIPLIKPHCRNITDNQFFSYVTFCGVCNEHCNPNPTLIPFGENIQFGPSCFSLSHR